MKQNQLTIYMILAVLLGICIFVPIFIIATDPSREFTSDPNITDPTNCVVLILTTSGLGSGSIISPDGIILTAAHMVQNTYLEEDILPVAVVLADGTRYTEFECLYVSRHLDIAYFKIKDVENLPHLELGDSSNLQPGDEVWAIGMPYGIEWWYSYGFISKAPNSGAIYMDMSLNPGNSGCPILNSDNEIIGMCTSGIPMANDMVFGHTSNACKPLLELYRVIFDLDE